MRTRQTVEVMKRFICLVLAVLLLSEAPSWDAIAAEPADTYTDNSETAPESSGTWTELTERRTENAKWFTDSAGSLKVTVYDTAVHVETEDGWQEAEWFVEASAPEAGEDAPADTGDAENVRDDNVVQQIKQCFNRHIILSCF